MYHIQGKFFFNPSSFLNIYLSRKPFLAVFSKFVEVGQIFYVYNSVGDKPKSGPAAKIWLGQFFPNFDWAIYGWANFFHIMAGPLFGWAKNGCGWPSQTGFYPTLVYNTLKIQNFFK